MSSLVSSTLAIQHRVSLASYTTFKIGGFAEYFYEAENLAGLTAALTWARAKQYPVTILGGGSNVLVADEGVSGLVISMKTKGREVITEDDKVLVTLAAGEVWDDVVSFCVENGWWGIENLSAIPGSVGAFPIQNVGAYGVAAEDVVVAVTAVHKDSQEEKIFTHDECRFSYRDSFFKSEAGKSYVVTAVTLQLSRQPSPRLSYKDLKEYFENNNETRTLQAIRKAVCAIRSRKFPDLQTYGTAGSFFKNPVVPIALKQHIEAQYPAVVSYPVDESFVKLSAAWLIDNVLQMRGRQEGAVGTYKEQALVVVNYGGASAEAVKTFTQNIQTQLYKKIGVMLEYEVQNIF